MGVHQLPWKALETWRVCNLLSEQPAKTLVERQYVEMPVDSYAGLSFQLRSWGSGTPVWVKFSGLDILPAQGKEINLKTSNLLYIAERYMCLESCAIFMPGSCEMLFSPMDDMSDTSFEGCLTDTCSDRSIKPQLSS